jgi:hypothetical protein
MQTGAFALCRFREIPPLSGSLEPEQHLSQWVLPIRQRKLRDEAMKTFFN